MEKRLWRDVLRSFNSNASNPNSGTLKTLQSCYMKLLLPYECHMKNLDLSDCLAKFENSRHGSVGSPSSNKEIERVNHSGGDTPKLGDSTLESIMEGKVNGDSQSLSEEQIRGDQRLSQRSHSLDSEASSGRLNNREDLGMGSVQGTPTPSQDGGSQMPLGLDQGSQKQDGLDIPEGSQNSVDTYSQGMSSTEPLPDISVQEAESLLGMSPSPYPTLSQPTGGPGTPSAQQNTPSPSYPGPPHYPQHSNREWTSTGHASDFMSGLDPTAMGPAPNPPAYPPSYPMDPTTGYRPPSHPSPMHPGYSPYSTPTQPELPPEYQQRMQSVMMRSPYHGGSPYPGMSPSMPMGAHPRQMDSNPYSSPYRSPMMPQPMRRMDEMAYPGMGMPPDWPWQHRSRFPSPLPSHMQSPSYQKHMQHYSSSPRSQNLQQATVPMQQHRASPGHPSSGHPSATIDAIKIQWQEQNRSAQAAKVALEKAMAKPVQQSESSPANKTLSSKHYEHLSATESLKRPLPDWNNCVEGTKPQLVKRRRLYSGDCGK